MKKHDVEPWHIVILIAFYCLLVALTSCQKKTQFNQFIDVKRVTATMEAYRSPVMATIEAALPVLDAERPELAAKVRNQAPVILAGLQDLKFSLIEANNAAAADRLPELLERGFDLAQKLNGLYAAFEGVAGVAPEYFMLAQLLLGFVPDKPVQFGRAEYIDPAGFTRTDYEAWGSTL